MESRYAFITHPFAPLTLLCKALNAASPATVHSQPSALSFILHTEHKLSRHPAMSFCGYPFFPGTNNQGYHNYNQGYGSNQGYGYGQESNMPEGAIRAFYPGDGFEIHSQWIGDDRGSQMPYAEWEDQQNELLDTPFTTGSDWYGLGGQRRANMVATRDDYYTPFQSMLERDGCHAYHPGQQAIPQFGVRGAQARRRAGWGDARPSFDHYNYNDTFNLSVRDRPDFGSFQFGEW